MGFMIANGVMVTQSIIALNNDNVEMRFHNYLKGSAKVEYKTRKDYLVYEKRKINEILGSKYKVFPKEIASRPGQLLVSATSVDYKADTKILLSEHKESSLRKIISDNRFHTVMFVSKGKMKFNPADMNYLKKIGLKIDSLTDDTHIVFIVRNGKVAVQDIKVGEQATVSYDVKESDVDVDLTSNSIKTWMTVEVGRIRINGKTMTINNIMGGHVIAFSNAYEALRMVYGYNLSEPKRVDIIKLPNFSIWNYVAASYIRYRLFILNPFFDGQNNGS